MNAATTLCLRRFTLALLLGLGLTGISHPVAAAGTVKVSAASVTTGGFSARHVALLIDAQTGAIEARAADAGSGSTSLGSIVLKCAEFALASTPTPKATVACEKLEMSARGETLIGRASVGREGALLSLTVAPKPGAARGLPPPASAETLELALTPDGTGSARAAGIALTRLNEWLPQNQPQLSGGTLSANVAFTLPTTRAPLSLDATALVTSAAFADTPGLRAGEKIAATLAGRALQTPNGWAVAGHIQQTAGEVFWQPIYLGTANNRLDFDVELNGQNYVARSLKLSMGGMGTVSASGRGTLAAPSLAQGLREAKLSTGDVNLTRVYLDLIKPVAAGTLLAELDVSGRAQLELDVANGKAERVRANLSDINITDPQGRIGVTNLSLDLPWVRSEATGAALRWQAATFYKVPLGAVQLPIALSPETVEMRYVRIPILDGALELDRFAGDRTDGSWPIVISGRITPIAMPALTRALGMPEMAGTLAAELPGMVHHQRALSINGEFKMRVFDGEIVARDVHVEEALGKSPRMTGHIAARTLDLALITQTFKFGRMEGRIDADLKDIELVNWRPNRLDARIASSAGDYRRKISQQAVQNISSLGGAGAAAAIQRSVLRFFEEFGYEKLGLTCKLSAAVCEMGGVESAPQGYVLVKGGGIPAISVLGYNRRVSWQELVRRVTAAVESNEKPLIK